MQETSSGNALTVSSQPTETIQAKLDEFAAEIEITEELTAFYRSVVDGSMTVQVLKRGTRGEPDETFEQGPTIHERISAAKALASLTVRRPGTKPLPLPDVEERKRSAEDIVDELERRFLRARELHDTKQITEGEVRDG